MLRYPYCGMAMMQDMTNTFLNLFSKRPPLLRFSWGAAPLTPLAFDPHVAILSSYRRVSKASPAISLSSRRCCAQTPHQTTCMLMLVCARQAAYCDPGLISEVIVPLLSMQQSCLLCISTLLESGNRTLIQLACDLAPDRVNQSHPCAQTTAGCSSSRVRRQNECPALPAYPS